MTVVARRLVAAAPRVSRGIVRQIPAPIGGLNARDSIAQMAVSDAIVLDNLFPERSWVQLRRGFVAHATGLPGPVETLMEYAGSSASLWAVAGGSIYDVTAAGPVGSPAVSGLSGNRWQHLMFTNTAGTWLVMANGVDPVRLYNGSAWSTASITGVSSADLFCVGSWKRRLWFGEKDRSRVWYLGADAIGGAATMLDLGGVWRLGGTIAGILASSFEADGLDDYIGFVSSRGEVALYRGTDPSSASTFGLVGVYRLGAPIGRRFYTQVGGDLAVLTADGVVSLMQSLALDRSASARSAVTDRISTLFASAVANASSQFGWEVKVWPEGTRLIVNVPVTAATAHQYVMNTLSGAWCRMTGMNAACWQTFGGNLYFGHRALGRVFRAEVGGTDDGAAIPYEMRTAFHDYGLRSRWKRFTMVRLLLEASADFRPNVLVNVDYGDKKAVNVPVVNSGGGALWDTALWDQALWSGLYVQRPWAAVHGVGHVASVCMSGIVSGVDMRLAAMDVTFEPAQALGL